MHYEVQSLESIKLRFSPTYTFMEKVKPGKKMTNHLPYNLNQRALLI